MRILTLTCTALLAIGLAGCSAPADDTGTGTDDTPTSPSGSQQAEPEAKADEECGGLTTEALVGLFGTDLEGPDPSMGSSNQSGATWTSTGCGWENEDAELDIDLDISGPSDFPGGTINCVKSGGVGKVTPVEGLGTQAWWKFEDFFNEIDGVLRVCTDDQLVELAVDAQTGAMTSDELLEKAESAVLIVVG